MTKKKRTNKRGPSPQAVRWHEGYQSVTDGVTTGKNLIISISQYAAVIGNPEFTAKLTEEQVQKLSRSVAVAREAGTELSSTIGKASVELLAEKNAPYEKRSCETILLIDATVIDGLMKFNEAAVDSGHLDVINDIINEVTNMETADEQ